MPSNQLYPSEMIENTLESYLPKVTVRSQAIYSTLVISIILIIISLPFIYTDVSVSANGIIRPITDKTDVKSLIAAPVKLVLVKENEKVLVDQPIVVLRADLLENKLRLNALIQKDKMVETNDLKKLVTLEASSTFPSLHLQSALYRQQFNEFLSSSLKEIERQKYALKELDIDKHLFAERVIAEREFKEKEQNYQNSISSYKISFEQKISQWQIELTTAQLKLEELATEEKQLRQEMELYIIKSPISGTVQQLTGIYAGSYVQSGEVLARVSPDSMLLAECYVSPKDIGFIKQRLNVNFQIDAFDYNEWGFISGMVTEISDDFEIVNNQPFFKVKCNIEKDYLKLKNGYSGKLKKGMTLQARFILTRRSLFEILFSKANEWLNPAQKS
jgi:multidrug efflux pump subunit AcrA (membrane-fusion protein)